MTDDVVMSATGRGDVRGVSGTDRLRNAPPPTSVSTTARRTDTRDTFKPSRHTMPTVRIVRVLDTIG